MQALLILPATKPLKTRKEKKLEKKHMSQQIVIITDCITQTIITTNQKNIRSDTT